MAAEATLYELFQCARAKLEYGLFKTAIAATPIAILRDVVRPATARHNPAVAHSNPVPATCFSGCETGRPASFEKAGVQRRRPFRVLSPVVATTSSIAASLDVSVPSRRATFPSPARVGFLTRSRRKHSVVSASRRARVIWCCERPGSGSTGQCQFEKAGPIALCNGRTGWNCCHLRCRPRLRRLPSKSRGDVSHHSFNLSGRVKGGPMS